jgi:hypothetical protein
MNGKTTFTSDKETLQTLLGKIASGDSQIPEFQRGWVWDDAHIRSLLASISMSYPIGAIMMLETGNPDVRFKPRPVEGAVFAIGKEPERFILDGQQRLTALFQSILSNRPVLTYDHRGKEIKRWYYMQMSAALDPKTEREESIWGLPEDKTIKNFRGEIIADYSVPVSEYQNDLFPLNKLLNASEWRREYNKFWEYRRDKSDLFDQFEAEIIESFKQYLIPVIIIQKQTPKEAICQVFEKVNTGGVSLTVFELLTATFAADGFELRKDWEAKKARLTSLGKLGAVAKVLNAVQNDDVLQAITLLATFDKRSSFLASGGAIDQAPGISCKRRDILKLTLEDYKLWSDRAIEGFIRAGRLIYSQKVFDARDLPYRTQLVPLAAVLTMLQEKVEIIAAKEKLVQWYWCGVLGELYGGAIETRFANDLPEVLAWIDGSGREPRTVADANFHRSRLYTLQTRNSAAYKGISALLMRDGGFDFISGVPITEATYFDDKIDIHHIFPRDYCVEAKLDKKKWNCIINKTPISASTNRTIGGKAPSNYLPRIEKRAGVSADQMNTILKSHLIDPDSMRGDDFERFIMLREKELLKRIEKAMGKSALEDSREDAAAYYEDGETEA